MVWVGGRPPPLCRSTSQLGPWGTPTTAQAPPPGSRGSQAASSSITRSWTNGELKLGAQPLLDLSDNTVYADFLDVLRDGAPLPEALPRRFRDDRRPALSEAFERFERCV